MLLNIFSNPKS